MNWKNTIKGIHEEDYTEISFWGKLEKEWKFQHVSANILAHRNNKYILTGK